MRTSSIRALQSDTGLDRTAFQTVCVQRRQLGCRRDTARSLLQSAVPRRSCCRAPALVGSIDISRQHAAQQQTRRMPLLRFNDGTDGRTDGRTPDRYRDPAAHNAWDCWQYRASSGQYPPLNRISQRSVIGISP